MLDIKRGAEMWSVGFFTVPLGGVVGYFLANAILLLFDGYYFVSKGCSTFFDKRFGKVSVACKKNLYEELKPTQEQINTLSMFKMK